MSTEDTTSDTPVWGSPDAASRRWGGRETAVAVGIAAVIAALGGAAIYAATGHSTQGPGGTHAFGPGGPGFGPGGPGGPGFGPGGPGGPGFGPGGPDAVPAGLGGPTLHGQYVVRDTAGAFETVVTQTGTITASSPTSVTVRSEDDFTSTYAATADQTQGLAMNDVVSVRAVAHPATGTTAGSPALPTVTEIIGTGRNGPGGPPR